MFNLMLFLDVSEGRPGMLIPVLSSKKTNLPYVQQMDEFYEVREIIPFLEYENYPTIPSEFQLSVTTGDIGLIAFRSFDDTIFCGNIREVISYIADHTELLRKHPILRSQLQRLEGAELQPSYDVWRMVASSVFDNHDQRRLWIDSELQLFQKQQKIWSKIEAIEIIDSRQSAEQAYHSIAELGTEYLIRWLSSRTNYDSPAWTKVWHHVAAERIFDDRLAGMGMNWLIYQGSEGHDLQQAKSVLFVLLERWSSFGDELQHLGDFLSDQLMQDASLIFEFLRPKKLFSLVINFMAKKSDINDVLHIISFCITQLPKEPHVIDSLKAAIHTIIAETKKNEDNWRPHTRNRDFEERQSEAAIARWKQLEKLEKEISR